MKNKEALDDDGYTYLLEQEGLEPSASPQTKVPTEAHNLWGMILVTCYLFMITMSTAIISYSGGSRLQWLIARYIGFLVVCPLAWMMGRPTEKKHIYGDSIYETKVIVAHAVLEVAQEYLYYYALYYVYVGDMEAIFLFIAPNLISFIGRAVFKEALPKFFLVILVLNIIGVIFVTQPSFLFGGGQSISPLGLAFCTASAILYSLDVVVIGQNPSVHWLQLQFGCSAVTVCILPFFLGVNSLFETDVATGGQFDFSWTMLACNFALSVLSIVGSVCLIYGYQMGESAKISYLEYVILVFAYSYQWIAFQELRNAWEVIGAGLIASTCFILFFSQYRLYEEEKTELENDTLSEHAHLLQLE